MSKKGTSNKYNNFVMRVRFQNYKINPYKKQYLIYYYKWPLTSPKGIIKEKRYRQRLNEIKTYNIKDREKLAKLYGIS